MVVRSVLSLFVVVLLSVTGCKKDSGPANNTGGTSGTPPPQLVGVWIAQSATVNGSPTALGIVLQWEAGVVSAQVSVMANGSYKYDELDASNQVVYTQSGTIAVAGTSITMTATSENGNPVNPPTLFLAGTWSVTGNQLTVSTTVSGNAIVITFVKGG